MLCCFVVFIYVYMQDRIRTRVTLSCTYGLISKQQAGSMKSYNAEWDFTTAKDDGQQRKEEKRGKGPHIASFQLYNFHLISTSHNLHSIPYHPESARTHGYFLVFFSFHRKSNNTSLAQHDRF